VKKEVKKVRPGVESSPSGGYPKRDK